MGNGIEKSSRFFFSDFFAQNVLQFTGYMLLLLLLLPSPPSTSRGSRALFAQSNSSRNNIVNPARAGLLSSNNYTKKPKYYLSATEFPQLLRFRHSQRHAQLSCHFC